MTKQFNLIRGLPGWLNDGGLDGGINDYIPMWIDGDPDGVINNKGVDEI